MEPCVSCIYLTCYMEYLWKSSLWIGIFQRDTERARILSTDNIRSRGSCSVNYYWFTATNHIKHCEINNSWTQFSHRKTTSISLRTTADLACSKRSDSGERCEVKKAMKSRGGLETPLLLPRVYFFALLFTSHRSPLSERLEQATADSRIERNR